VSCGDALIESRNNRMHQNWGVASIHCRIKLVLNWYL